MHERALPWPMMGTIAVGALVAVGCAAKAVPVAVDPSLTFAAHETHAGLVIDRDASGGTAVATPEGGLHLESVYELRAQDGSVQRLRVMSPGHVVVERHPAPSEHAEFGRVDPTWDNNAIRLTIRPADGPALQSGLFRRTDYGAGSAVLTRNDRDRIDLEGAYQAALRTPDGATVGWLGFVIGKGQPGHVMYEAVLPRTIDTGLAAGAATALGSEIAYIEANSHGISRKPQER